MKLLSLSIFAVAVALAVYVQPAKAPEIAALMKDQSRIAADPNAVVIQFVAGSGSIEPCTMESRVKWHGECWLPERIPREVER